MTDLTPTQKIILKAASKRADGNIEPLPANINAGVKPRVIQGLLKRDLIKPIADRYVITRQGLEAIGAPLPTPGPHSPPVTPRVGTKQANMIKLMEQPEGASIEDICSLTGWQQHTVRGMFAHTLKKRLGLTVTSYKDDDQQRRYRIQGRIL